MTPEDVVLGLAELSPEQREILQKGRAAYELVRSPGWQLLLDWLEERSNAALARLRKNASSDPQLIKELNRSWAQNEEVLQKIQEYALSLKDEYEALIQTSQDHQGKSTEGDNLSV